MLSSDNLLRAILGAGGCAAVLRGKSPREPPEDGKIPYLHRSESSRRLFELALRKADSRKAPELTPTLLAESLFDMKLASLESV